MNNNLQLSGFLTVNGGVSSTSPSTGAVVIAGGDNDMIHSCDLDSVISIFLVSIIRPGSERICVCGNEFECSW